MEQRPFPKDALAKLGIGTAQVHQLEIAQHRGLVDAGIVGALPRERERNGTPELRKLGPRREDDKVEIRALS